MKPLYRTAFAAMILALLMFPAANAHADISPKDLGPKPSAQFKFEYKIPAMEIVSGKLIQCEDAACAAGRPLQQAGPQGFGCKANECSSLAYGYTEYQKLVITFADKTRESNVFTKRGFSSTYVVTVHEDSLTVKEDMSLSSLNPISALFFLLLAVPVTLVIELAIAGIYLAVLKQFKHILWVFVANVISLPMVWCAFPFLPVNAVLVIALAEVFAFVFEALFLYFISRRAVSLKHAFLLSFLTNGVSFGLDLLVGWIVLMG